MLNIKDAFRLYSLLKNHLPEKVDSDVLQFVGTIIDSMIANGEHKNYTIAIQMMNNIMLSEIAEMKPLEVVTMFTEGLIENKIMKLHAFFGGIS